MRRLRGIRRAVTVASDTTWMTRSVSADGSVVDEPRRPYAIPLETTAVSPSQFSAFLPQVDRASVEAALAGGEGILGQSSAQLRRIGPGATLEFGSRSVRVAAVLPDELVGASELMVSRDVGARLGVLQDRYALLQPHPMPSARGLAMLLRTILPPDLPLQVRAPGETPYPRQGDAVLPPVKIKLLFGEFAARPDPGNPGYLQIDPAWVRSHIEVRTLPLVGNIQCNVALFPQLRGALDELVRRGLGNLIHTEHGCYVPKFVLNDPHASISHHSWGMAFDLNLAGNEYGQPPHQDPRLVRILAKWGFLWGGRFIIPDGNHFEYRRPPAASAP
jgi:D-alanyl-D-alanine carboxypeptidase